MALAHAYIDERKTARRVTAVVRRSRELVDDRDGLLLAAGTDPRDTLGQLVTAALHAIETGDGSPTLRAELLTVAVEAQRLIGELQARAFEWEGRVHRQLAEGLSRLRELGSTHELVEVACEEAARSCGFARVLLSRVDGGHWRPSRFSCPADARMEAVSRAAIAGLNLPLSSTPVEERVVNTCQPELAGPGGANPVDRLMCSRFRVVAPIGATAGVLGLFHADRGDETAVDRLDRDRLWIFAKGFARIYEREQFSERLRAQQDRTAATLRAVETIAATADGSKVAMARNPAERRPAVGLAPVVCDRRDLLADLTEREREVVALLISGCSNAQIAERLVIAPGTAKTHVSRILRKLGAPNRAAVTGTVLAAPRG